MPTPADECDLSAGSRVGLWRILFAPILIALAVSLPKLDQGEFNVDTGWYAAIALQSWRALPESFAGFWTLQGLPDPALGTTYFNKPPLGFWLGGWPLAAFGPSVWAARLGSVLAAVLCVVAATLTVRRFSSDRAAVGAGIVLALTIPFIGLARSFSLDLWMALFILLAMTPMLAMIERPSSSRIVVAGVMLGLAMLVKPIVPLLVPVAVIVWLVWMRRPRAVAAAIAASALALAVASTWHVAMAVRFGEAFLNQYFGSEMADRAASRSSSTVFNFGSASPLYYLRVLGETYWPWLVTVVLAVAALALGRVPRSSSLDHAPHGHATEDRRWIVFGLIWTLVWLIALSLFADKRPRYLAPLFPVWAWMSALWLVRPQWGAPARLRKIAQRGVLPLTLGVCAAAIVIAVAPVQLHSRRDQSWNDLLAWVDAHPHTPLYRGGFVGQRAARIYLHSGRWPLEAGDPLDRSGAGVPAGANLLYHVRDGLAPGPGEVPVFRAGSLIVTRLEQPPWRPAAVRDPGE